MIARAYLSLVDYSLAAAHCMLRSTKTRRTSDPKPDAQANPRPLEPDPRYGGWSHGC